MKIGDVVTLKDISVSEYFSMEEIERENYHIYFGEVGVINWVDDELARIGFVRESEDFRVEYIEVIDSE
jgi:hypothetical protein